MLVIVVLFLRESLEAALLFSTLMAMGSLHGLPGRWVAAALGLSFVIAGMVARNLAAITALADGFGQELMNASLLLLIAALLVRLCVVYLPLPGQASAQESPKHTALPWLFILVTVLALSHEGGELSIYSMAYLQTDRTVVPLVLGGTIGTGIGLSVGAMIYYLLKALPLRTLNLVMPVVLTLIAASASLQAATYLVQAGWLPQSGNIWDTSGWLPEDNLPGQLLYALLGYEATPDMAQLLFYVGTLSIYILLFALRRHRSRPDQPSGIL